MDFNILISELNSSSERLPIETEDRSHLSTVYCNNACKTLERVTEYDGDYDSKITGLWLIVAHFAEKLVYLRPVPALSELCFKLFRQCAKAVLNIQWQNLDEERNVRQNFLVSLSNLHSKLVRFDFLRFRLLETLTENPWTNPTLAKIMGGEVEPSEAAEVRKYIEDEDPIILQLRVDMMLSENCEEYALNLCISCLMHPELAADMSLRITQLSLLYKMGHEDKLQEECQRLSIQEALRIIKELNASGKQKDLYTVLAQTFMVQNWIRPCDTESSKELLRMWIQHQLLVDEEHDQFKDSIWAMAKLSHSTEQIVIIIDVLREECGDTFLQLYVDMSIFAVKVDKGQMETSISEGNMEAAAARRADMASVCAKLSCLCHHTSLKVARICVLTSFALMPTEKSFNKIGAFYGQGGDCCDRCEGRDFTKQESGTVNPATLYEVERLLNMLRPEYLNPDKEYTHIHMTCRRFLLESLKNTNVTQKKPIDVAGRDDVTITQVEGPGKKKPFTNKALVMFEALSPQDAACRQALLNKLRQQAAGLNSPRTSALAPSPTSRLGPHHHAPILANNKNKSRPPPVTLQPQQSVSLDAYLSKLLEHFTQAGHAVQTQQMHDILQAALRKDLNALHQLKKNVPASVVQAIMNLIEGNTPKQQIQQPSGSSSVSITSTSMPQVSPRLAPMPSSHQQQHASSRKHPRPQLYAQPIVVTTAASNPPISSLYNTGRLSGSTQAKPSGLPPNPTQLQLAEQMTMTKAHAQGVRQFVQAQLQQMDAAPGMVSGRVRTTVELAQQASMVKEMKKQQQQVKASHQLKAQGNSRGHVMQQQANNVFANVESGLVGLPGTSQNALPLPSSDELLGSITGIDDTIINDLLQDSGILANTFPDIEVDMSDGEKLRKSLSAVSVFNAAQTQRPQDNLKTLSGQQQLLLARPDGGIQQQVTSNNLRMEAPVRQDQTQLNVQPTIGDATGDGIKQESLGDVCLEEPTWRCIICSQVFPSIKLLQDHIRTVCKPGLQSSSVYTNKIEQDKADSARAGQETITVFQCLRCFELCLSQEGIQKHKEKCKRVPTIPEDIKKKVAAASAKGKSKPSNKQPKAEPGSSGSSRPHSRNSSRPHSRNSNSSVLSAHSPKLSTCALPNITAGSGTATSLCADMPQQTKGALGFPAGFPQQSMTTVANNLHQTSSNSQNVTGNIPQQTGGSGVVGGNVSQLAAFGNLTSLAAKITPKIKTLVRGEPQQHSTPVAPATAQLHPNIAGVNSQSPSGPPSQASAHPSNSSVLHSSQPSHPLPRSNVDTSQLNTSNKPSTHHHATPTPSLSGSMPQNPGATQVNPAQISSGATPLSNNQSQASVIKPECSNNKSKTPLPSYSEISGSGGSKFYRCNVCSQTLCSAPSFISHWKECCSKNKSVTQNKVHNEKNTSSEGLSQSHLQNVLNVIESVACGNFDHSDMRVALDPDIIKLKDPCANNVFPASNRLSIDGEEADSEMSWDSRVTFDNTTDSETDRNIPTQRLQTKQTTKAAAVGEIQTSESTFLSKNGMRSGDEDDCEDDSNSDSGSSTYSGEPTREAPPQLRDRKLLKPIQSLINESRYDHLNNSDKTDGTSENTTTSGTESDEDQLMCKVCHIVFQSKRILLQHYAGKHLQPFTVKSECNRSVYFCHLCHKSMSTFMDYMHHVPQHAVVISRKMKALVNKLNLSKHKGVFGKGNKVKLSPKQAKALRCKEAAAKSVADRMKRKVLERLYGKKSKSKLASSEDDLTPDGFTKSNKRNSNTVRMFKPKRRPAKPIVLGPDGKPRGRGRPRKYSSPIVSESIPQSSGADSQVDSEESRQTSTPHSVDEDYVARLGTDSGKQESSSPPSTRSCNRTSDSGDLKRRRHFSDSDTSVKRLCNSKRGGQLGLSSDNDNDNDSNSTTLSVLLQEDGCCVATDGTSNSKLEARFEDLKNDSVTEQNCTKLGILNRLTVRSLSRGEKELLKSCNLNPSVVLDALNIDYDKDVSPLAKIEEELSADLKQLEAKLATTTTQMEEKRSTEPVENADKKPTFLDSYLSYINRFFHEQSECPPKKSKRPAIPQKMKSASPFLSSFKSDRDKKEAVTATAAVNKDDSEDKHLKSNSPLPVRRCSVNLGKKLEMQDGSCPDKELKERSNSPEEKSRAKSPEEKLKEMKMEIEKAGVPIVCLEKTELTNKLISSPNRQSCINDTKSVSEGASTNKDKAPQVPAQGVKRPSVISQPMMTKMKISQPKSPIVIDDDDDKDDDVIILEPSDNEDEMVPSKNLQVNKSLEKTTTETKKNEKSSERVCDHNVEVGDKVEEYANKNEHCKDGNEKIRLNRSETSSLTGPCQGNSLTKLDTACKDKEACGSDKSKTENEGKVDKPEDDINNVCGSINTDCADNESVKTTGGVESTISKLITSEVTENTEHKKSDCTSDDPPANDKVIETNRNDNSKDPDNNKATSYKTNTEHLIPAPGKGESSDLTGDVSLLGKSYDDRDNKEKKSKQVKDNVATRDCGQRTNNGRYEDDGNKNIQLQTDSARDVIFSSAPLVELEETKISSVARGKQVKVVEYPEVVGIAENLVDQSQSGMKALPCEECSNSADQNCDREIDEKALSMDNQDNSEKEIVDGCDTQVVGESGYSVPDKVTVPQSSDLNSEIGDVSAHVGSKKSVDVDVENKTFYDQSEGLEVQQMKYYDSRDGLNTDAEDGVAVTSQRETCVEQLCDGRRIKPSAGHAAMPEKARCEIDGVDEQMEEAASENQQISMGEEGKNCDKINVDENSTVSHNLSENSTVSENVDEKSTVSDNVDGNSIVSHSVNENTTVSNEQIVIGNVKCKDNLDDESVKKTNYLIESKAIAKPGCEVIEQIVSLQSVNEDENKEELNAIVQTESVRASPDKLEKDTNTLSISAMGITNSTENDKEPDGKQIKEQIETYSVSSKATKTAEIGLNSSSKAHMSVAAFITERLHEEMSSSETNKTASTESENNSKPDLGLVDYSCSSEENSRDGPVTLDPSSAEVVAHGKQDSLRETRCVEKKCLDLVVNEDLDKITGGNELMGTVVEEASKDDLSVVGSENKEYKVGLISKICGENVLDQEGDGVVGVINRDMSLCEEKAVKGLHLVQMDEVSKQNAKASLSEVSKEISIDKQKKSKVEATSEPEFHQQEKQESEKGMNLLTKTEDLASDGNHDKYGLSTQVGNSDNKMDLEMDLLSKRKDSLAQEAIVNSLETVKQRYVRDSEEESDETVDHQTGGGFSLYVDTAGGINLLGQSLLRDRCQYSSDVKPSAKMPETSEILKSANQDEGRLIGEEEILKPDIETDEIHSKSNSERKDACPETKSDEAEHTTAMTLTIKGDSNQEKTDCSNVEKNISSKVAPKSDQTKKVTSPDMKNKMSLGPFSDSDDADDLGNFELVIEADTSSNNIVPAPNKKIASYPEKTKQPIHVVITKNSTTELPSILKHTSSAVSPSQETYNSGARKLLSGAKGLRKDSTQFVWDVDADNGTGRTNHQFTPSMLKPQPSLNTHVPLKTLGLPDKKDVSDSITKDAVCRKRKALKEKTETAPFTWDLDETVEKTCVLKNEVPVKNLVVGPGKKLLNSSSKKIKVITSETVKKLATLGHKNTGQIKRRAESQKVTPSKAKVVQRQETVPSLEGSIGIDNEISFKKSKLSESHVTDILKINTDSINNDKRGARNRTSRGTPQSTPSPKMETQTAEMAPSRRTRPLQKSKINAVKPSEVESTSKANTPPKIDGPKTNESSKVSKRRVRNSESPDNSTIEPQSTTKRKSKNEETAPNLPKQKKLENSCAVVQTSKNKITQEEPQLKKAGLVRVSGSPGPVSPGQTNSDPNVHNTRSCGAAIKAFNQKSLRNRGVNPVKAGAPTPRTSTHTSPSSRQTQEPASTPRPKTDLTTPILRHTTAVTPQQTPKVMSRQTPKVSPRQASTVTPRHTHKLTPSNKKQNSPLSLPKTKQNLLRSKSATAVACKTCLSPHKTTPLKEGAKSVVKKSSSLSMLHKGSKKSQVNVKTKVKPSPLSQTKKTAAIKNSSTSASKLQKKASGAKQTNKNHKKPAVKR